MKLKCTDQAILSDSGIDKSIGYSVPLEIMPSGQFEPLYKTALSIQDGELPVLPLSSVYGVVVMAHDDVSEEYSSPNKFFFYLYDKSYSGLGGLSLDEGQFSVFRYIVLEDILIEGLIQGSVVHFHRARTVTVSLTGRVSTSRMGCMGGVVRGHLLSNDLAVGEVMVV